MTSDQSAGKHRPLVANVPPHCGRAHCCCGGGCTDPGRADWICPRGEGMSIFGWALAAPSEMRAAARGGD